MAESTMVDTDVMLSNEQRRFGELPIEARHSICLEIAKRKRQSVATSIFIPKELSRKIRFVKKHQRREKNESAILKQAKLKKLIAEKKNSLNKSNILKKKSQKIKRKPIQQQQQQPKVVRMQALNHPESYPIIKPKIPTQKIRSILESLRESQDEHEEPDEPKVQQKLQKEGKLQEQHEPQGQGEKVQLCELKEQDELQEQHGPQRQSEMAKLHELKEMHNTIQEERISPEQDELLKLYELQEQEKLHEQHGFQEQDKLQKLNELQEQDKLQKQHGLQGQGELLKTYELLEQDKLQEQQKLQKQGEPLKQYELQENERIQQHAQMLQQNELEKQYETKEQHALQVNLPMTQKEQTFLMRHLTKQTKLVEEQIQLGAEQKMTISYTVELPENLLDMENNISQNYIPKIEISKSLKAPKDYNNVDIDSYGTLYTIDESAAQTENAQNMEIAEERLLKEETYLRGAECDNVVDHYNQSAPLSSCHALLAGNNRNWNLTGENQLQQNHLPIHHKTHVEQSNTQNCQRSMSQENMSHQKTRNKCSTNLYATFDTSHNNDSNVAQSNRVVQLDMDNHHYKQSHLMPQMPQETNFMEHNFTQMPDNARGLTFFAQPTYPYYYQQQQPKPQQHPPQQRLVNDARLLPPPPPTAPTDYPPQQQRLLTDNRLIQPPNPPQHHSTQQQRQLINNNRLLPAPPPTAAINYSHYCQDRLQIDPILQNLNSQERHLTNASNAFNTFNTWHRPVDTQSHHRRHLKSHSRRTAQQKQKAQPQPPSINIQQHHQQNIPTTTYTDYIPRLPPQEYFHDNRTAYQACNWFSNLSQNYPMDLTIPLPPMPPMPPPQYRHPQIEYQIQPPLHQKYYHLSNSNCNSCSIAVPPYTTAPLQNLNHMMAQLQPADLTLRDPNAWFWNKQREYFHFCGVDHSSNNNCRNIRTM